MVFPRRQGRIWRALVGPGLGAALLGAGPSDLAGQQAPSDFARLLAQGDSAWTGRSFPEARRAYAQALGLDSLASSRAVYRLGVLRSWDNALTEAIGLFQLYVRLEPRDEEGRIALARTYAWHGAYEASVATYDSVLARDRTYRDAALGAAQALAWAGRHGAALHRYEAWLREHGDDQDAALARARTLAWAGRLRDSEAAYRQLAGRGELLEAEKGLAVVAAWRGDLGTSERRWERLATRVPRDPEVWVGLAQVQRWAGRPAAARQALERALAIDPTHADAREQLRWARADLAPAVEPGSTAFWDSDGNRSTLVTLSGSARTLGPARLGVGASYRTASLEGTTASSRSARASVRATPAPWVAIRGEAGVVGLSGDKPGAAARTEALATVAATVRPLPTLSLGASWGRLPFEETAPLIRSGITLASAGLSGELRLAGRVGLALGYDHTDIRGGSVANSRRTQSGSLRFSPTRRWSLALIGRRFEHDASPRDGYFAPREFGHAEASVRVRVGRDLGFGFEGDLGVGIQRVRFDQPAEQRGTQRIGGRVVYRPGPGSEVSVSYQFGNVAGAAAGIGSGSVYHASALSVGARVIW